MKTIKEEKGDIFKVPSHLYIDKAWVSAATPMTMTHEIELRKRRTTTRRAATTIPPFLLSFSSDSLPFLAVWQRWWSGQRRC